MKFAINRSEWCNVENIEIIYDAIYSELIMTGIDKKYDGDGQWKYMHGNDDFNSSDVLGRKCKYYLTHPEYLLFVDEVCK